MLGKVLLRHTVIFCLYTDVATNHTHLFNKIVHMNAVQYIHDISMHTRFVDSGVVHFLRLPPPPARIIAIRMKIFTVSR